jgi:integrase
MKNSYRKFRRGNVWWCQKNQTGKQDSLHTKDKAEAIRLLDLKNQPNQCAGFHVQMARTHLLVSDPQAVTRTWQKVMDAILRTKTGNTKNRWERAIKSRMFDDIRNLIVVETKSDAFLAVLNCGKVSANVFLRRIHNFGLDMNWLLAPVIPKRAWPQVEYSEKRAITFDEHQRILARETNPERKAYYELCWHMGGSQSDMANLCAENIDWQNRTVEFQRMKTKEKAEMAFGSDLEIILRSLPATGALFPYLAKVRATDRATEFKQRCNGLGISGVTLHSYRYSWAERAKTCGFPIRFAQEALGHGSAAVHRAYAKNGEVKVPSLESYEKDMKEKIVPLDGQDAVAA